MENNINWSEVEQKIAIICNKFDNLSNIRDDLAQELRIHAYYVSDNYYDLYRKAIDIWRKVQVNNNYESPYYDLEVLNPEYYDKEKGSQFPTMVNLIKKEISRPGEDAWDERMLALARDLFDIILEDIDPSINIKHNFVKSKLNHYINQRLNLSWVCEETGVGYKRLVNAMKYLEDIVRGLSYMGKIDIPDEFK